MSRSAGYVPPTEVRPPSRAEYEGAVSRVALLSGSQPPEYVTYVPADSPGAPPRPMSNPAYTRRREAQRSAQTDRALIGAYEGFAERHAALYADVSARVTAGLGSSSDQAFASAYAAHVAEQEQAAA